MLVIHQAPGRHANIVMPFDEKRQFRLELRRFLRQIRRIGCFSSTAMPYFTDARTSLQDVLETYGAGGAAGPHFLVAEDPGGINTGTGEGGKLQ